MFSPKSAPVLTPPDGIGGGKPAKPIPKPTPSPILPPTPPPGPPTQENPPTQRSTGHESKSDSGKRNDSGRDKSDKKTTPSKPPESQPSISGFPKDIEWSPEFEARGIMPIMQAAVDALRDSSEDRTTAVCAALYAANPEAVARGVTIMTGCEPDDEQDVLPACISLARSVGFDEYLSGDEPWRAMKLSSPEPPPVTVMEAESPADQAQVPAEADQFEQPEINLTTQYFLSESYPEWDPTWTDKEDLEYFLKGKLKANFRDFDKESVDWSALSVEEIIAHYRGRMAEETAALWTQYQDTSNEAYQQTQAEYDRATGLLAMAQAIPLDDTEAYAAAFAGIAYVPDAEHERRHVESQLKLIYDQILGEESDHLATLSTTELKYELYYRLNYDVRSFVSRDEHEVQLQIADFVKDYTYTAGATPAGAIDRLQGSFRQPDVLGFLFVMGLSIAFEPVDWALTAVDVIQALAEDDIESAIGNALLGAAPFVSSKMDDLIQPVLNRMDNVPLLPARAGSTLLSRDELRRLTFSDEMIHMFETRGATGPGSGLAEHRRILGEGPEHTSAVLKRGDSLGHRTQDADAHILREQYGYNVISEPSNDMLERAGIDSSGRTPDYFIEGRPFDAYTVSPPRDPNSTESTLIRTVWNALYKKVPSQTDRLVMDLSHTPLTSERFIEDLSRNYVIGEPLTDPMLKELREIKFMRDGRLTDTWVKPLLQGE